MPGGIDLDRNKMHMNVSHDAAMGGLVVKVDKALIEQVKRSGFEGIEFRIESIKQVNNFLQY